MSTFPMKRTSRRCPKFQKHHCTMKVTRTWMQGCFSSKFGNMDTSANCTTTSVGDVTSFSGARRSWTTSSLWEKHDIRLMENQCASVSHSTGRYLRYNSSFFTVDSFAIAPPERLLRRRKMRRTTGAIANEINCKWVHCTCRTIFKQSIATCINLQHHFHQNSK